MLKTVVFSLLALPLFLQSATCRRNAKMERIRPPKGLQWMDVSDEDTSVGEESVQYREESHHSPMADVFWGKPKKEAVIKLEQYTEEEQLEETRPPMVDSFWGRPKTWEDTKLEQFRDEEDEEQDTSPVNAFWEWAKMVARGDEDRDQRAHRHNQVHKSRFANPRPTTIFNNHRAPDASRPRRRPANIRPDMPPCLRPTDEPFRAHRTHPRAWEHPGFEASLPRQWDWRNVSGRNYCSPNRNQHIPVYCGGCWVFGTLGALQDRFNVARRGRWPMIQLSPQEIIACNGRGNCTAGGTAQDVFDHAKVHGLVEEGCNNYKAVNEKCTPFTRCGSCWPDHCFAIKNYTRYYIKDFGTVSGREAMMSEIMSRGPIACQIAATEQFDMHYYGGIYEEMVDAPSNHIVSVSGWGWDEDTKTEYWIVRNSWGDAWGEMGWFRIVTSLYKGGRGDQYNLGIERECFFVDPDISNLDF